MNRINWWAMLVEIGSHQIVDPLIFGWHSGVETMASSSTYDVFLSFRGPDTRKGITCDLYVRLTRSGLMAFMDDPDFEVGDVISPTLLEAIQRSRICVIVISPNYASSRWCLEELRHIMELWRREDRLVLPIFYNVDPSQVRKQKRSIGEALEKHHHSGRQEQTKVLEWRAALTQVANICGWDTKNHRTQRDLILDVVKSILSKGLPTRLNISIYPLRYDKCDEYLKVFLQAGPQEVVTVGICGPGQMGKTAMARVMYDQILHNFDGACFLADVGRRSYQPNYLVRLQETLLSEILSERNVKISDTRMGSDLIAQNLCSKRVLVVLDNVDDLRQIYALVGDRKFFGPGSKIIITSRDVQLLELFGVDQFILAHGRPLPENVVAIWEPYQRSRCIVAGLKEYIETFNHQKQENLRYLEAVLLQERLKNATQKRSISELLEAHGEGSASTDCTVTRETVTNINGTLMEECKSSLDTGNGRWNGGKAKVYSNKVQTHRRPTFIVPQVQRKHQAISQSTMGATSKMASEPDTDRRSNEGNFASIGEVVELNGNNYRKWRNDIEFYMGMHQNIDYCLLNPKPVGTHEENNMDADSSWHYYEWFRTNRMAKNVLMRTMSEVVRGSIEEPEDAVDFMAAIAEKYKESEKAEAARLLKEFHELKYDGNGSVREHIMHKVQLNGQLRDLRMGVADAELVHDALWSLPSTFSQLRSTYNALEVKWTINKLISVCVDEENTICGEA